MFILKIEPLEFTDVVQDRERKGKREKSQVLAWTAALVLFIKAQEWSS